MDRESLLQVLASLPPADPRRNEFATELAQMEPQERERWTQIMKESDAFHEALPQIDVPGDLESRLLAIPAQNGARAVREPLSLRRILLAVACLLVIFFAGYFVWQSWPTAPNASGYYVALDPKVANTIATIAVRDHEADPPLQIASNDPQTVERSLKTPEMPFPAIVPAPRVPLTLQGGGICAFGPTKAVFTRWTSGSTTYTLYQFDGKNLHAPSSFYRLVVPVKKLSHGPYDYRVSIWPGYGNPCTWALVMENDKAADAFD